MGVMSDLSGNASQKPKGPMAERKFANVDMDNFEDYMSSVAPAVTFRVQNKLSGEGKEQLGVNLSFKKMDDFTPGAIARQVPELRKLLEAREQLANLQRYMDGKVAAEDQLKKLLSDPDLMRAVKSVAMLPWRPIRRLRRRKTSHNSFGTPKCIGPPARPLRGHFANRGMTWQRN